MMSGGLLAVLVALAPVTSMTEGKEGLAAVEKTLAAALASVPDQEILSAARVRERLRAAKRRDLESCEGDAGCLGELGRAVGAAVVVSGEVAALAGGRVVYLKAVDAARGTLLRSTVLTLGETAGGDDTAARAGAFRLLAPEAHVGRLDLAVDVAGAEVFLDGALVGRAPLPPLPVPVGTHALRVTHPRTRDFVRFVEVRFGEVVAVRADLQAYPIVGDRLRPRGDGARPWYERPWVLVGATAAVTVATAVLVALIPRAVERDRDVTVGAPP